MDGVCGGKAWRQGAWKGVEAVQGRGAWTGAWTGRAVASLAWYTPEQGAARRAHGGVEGEHLVSAQAVGVERALELAFVELERAADLLVGERGAVRVVGGGARAADVVDARVCARGWDER